MSLRLRSLAVAKTAGDEWMTAPAVAKLLGVRQNTVYALVDAGELVAEITIPPGPKRRRSVRIPRRAVDDYIERARIRPGELRHLHENWYG